MKKAAIAVVLGLIAAVAGAADQPAAAPAAKMDPEACMKHCKEMGAAHAKLMESQKAAGAKQDAAWKQIEADLASAKKATGEKKVAALESVLEKLVALHAEMRQTESAHGMMAAANAGMDCCAGKGGAAMASMSGKAMDCCAGESHPAGMMSCDHEAPAAAAPTAKK